MKKSIVINKLIPFAVFVLSIISIVPLFHSGIFSMHDSTHLARTYEMYKALGDGQFPVRWVSDLGYGYGYPIFNFYAPLPYYLGALFMFVGFDVVSATKIVFGLSLLLSSLFMYSFLYSVFKDKMGAFLGSMLYLYTPYHAVDIYVRGALGELWVFVFLPILFSGIFGVFKSRHVKKYVFLTSIGLSGIILSHTITGMLTGLGFSAGIFIVALFSLQKKHLRTLLAPLVSSLFLGLGYSCFFWLPALSETAYTSVSTLVQGGSDFRNHFVFLDQFWNSPWGYGGSAGGRFDGVSYMLGKIHILLLSLVLVSALFRKTYKDEVHKKIIFLLLVTVVSLFMITDYSLPLWNLFSPLAFVQYPWRFLTFATFGIAAIGSMTYLLLGTWKNIFVGFFILLVILFNYKYFTPQKYQEISPADATSQTELQWNISSVIDEYMPSDFVRPHSFSETRNNTYIQGENLVVFDQIASTRQIDLKVYSPKSQPAVLSLAYFPGWKVFANGIDIPYHTNNGKIVIPVSVGTTEIKAVFGDTPVRMLSNFISILSAIVAVGFFYVVKKTNR